MNSTEKEISYQISNTYSTLNSLTKQTKNVWLVCHGMGYLSRYFLKYFKDLDPTENYIIAPQAQSKYYLKDQFKHVGASWLTKENTVAETHNILNYLDAVLENEQIPSNHNFIVIGYSQGVSIAMRYVSSRKLQCNHLVLMSGGLPKELTEEDLSFYKGKVSMIYGTKDEYLHSERLDYERNRMDELFGKKAEIIPFEGNHMVNVELINSLV
ncbi:esterase [Flavobacteriaceae sp. LMIT009]